MSRIRERVQLGQVTNLGKGTGDRVGKCGRAVGTGLRGLEPIGRGRRAGVVSRMSLRLVERCDRPLLRGPGRAWFCGLWLVFSASRARPGIATCPAEDKATCRCWTALRPDRRPSSTTPGPHDLPRYSPSTPDRPTITSFSQCLSRRRLGCLGCRRCHNRTPAQTKTRDKSVFAPRLFEAMFHCRKVDSAAGRVQLLDLRGVI